MPTIVRISSQSSPTPLGMNLEAVQFALPLATFGIGYFFWQNVAQNIGLAGFLLLFFLTGSLSRWVAFASYATFHLGFTTPMIAASQVFLELEATQAYLLWFGHSLLCGLPFLLLKGRWPGLRAASVFLLFVVPPFGYLAPNNPALAVGALYPALGWMGIVLTAALLWAAAEIRTINIAKAVAALAVLSSVAANVVWSSKPHEAPSNWHAGNTKLGVYADNITKRKDIANLHLPLDFGVRAYEFRDHEQIWFLPEGIIHDKEPVTDLIWGVALTGRNATAIVGEYFRDKDGTMYSGVRVLGKPRSDTKAVADARASITFPVSMWHPWRKDDHFPMTWPKEPVDLDGQRLHLSWCAESTILWPAIRASFLDRPTVMVSLENRWVTKDTSLEDAQTAGARLIARFLGASLLQALNH